MKITVEFNDVYDGVEHKRTEELHVPAPKVSQGLDDWALDTIFPHTGDGSAVDKDAGYFAEIVACELFPGLVGQKFEWGI